jgi:hypothetical protein
MTSMSAMAIAAGAAGLRATGQAAASAAAPGTAIGLAHRDDHGDRTRRYVCVAVEPDHQLSAARRDASGGLHKRQCRHPALTRALSHRPIGWRLLLIALLLAAGAVRALQLTTIDPGRPTSAATTQAGTTQGGTAPTGTTPTSAAPATTTTFAAGGATAGS